MDDVTRMRNGQEWSEILHKSNNMLWRFEAELEFCGNKYTLENLNGLYGNWSTMPEFTHLRDDLKLVLGVAYKRSGFGIEALQLFQALAGPIHYGSEFRHVQLATELAFHEVTWMNGLLYPGILQCCYRKFAMDVLRKNFDRAGKLYLMAVSKARKEGLVEVLQWCHSGLDNNRDLFQSTVDADENEFSHGDKESLLIIEKKGLFGHLNLDMEGSSAVRQRILHQALERLDVVASSRNAKFLSGIKIHLGNDIKNRRLLTGIITAISSHATSVRTEDCSVTANSNVIASQVHDRIDEYLLVHCLWHMLGQPNCSRD